MIFPLKNSQFSLFMIICFDYGNSTLFMYLFPNAARQAGVNQRPKFLSTSILFKSVSHDIVLFFRLSFLENRLKDPEIDSRNENIGIDN